MKSSIKFSLIRTFATDGTLLILGILTGSLAARLLLPDGRGALAAVLFWPQLLAGIGLLSLNEAATYRIGSKPEQASTITASCLWLSLVLAGLTILVGYNILPFLLGGQRAHLVWLTFIYLIIFIPFNFVALVLLANDQGMLDFSRYNLLRLLGPFIYLTGLLTLWALGHVSVALVVAFNCAGTVLLSVLCLILQRRRILNMPLWEEIVALFRLAKDFHTTTVLLFLAGQVDLFVVLTLWNDATVGKYSVALTIAASGLGVVSGTFYKVLFPHLVHAQDSNAQAALIARSVRHATFLLVGLSLPLASLMPWLVPLLFGDAFLEAVGPARILLIAYLIFALNTIVIQALRGLNESRPGAIAAAICLGVFLLQAWSLGNIFGLSGVATALVLANGSALIYLIYHLNRCFNLRIHDLWGLTPATMGEIWNSVFRWTPLSAK